MQGRILNLFGRDVRALSDIFFPRQCSVCGTFLDYDQKQICGECLADMPLTYSWDYPDNFVERRIIDKGVYVEAAASLFFYRYEGFSQVIRTFKYQGNTALWRFLSAQLGDVLARCPRFSGIEAVVPVPLHPLKRYRRGFNQAEIIAAEVAKAFGVKSYPHLVRKRRYTKTQTAFGTGERTSNVRGSFKVTARMAVRLKRQGICRVLLVDDVLTTGATVAAAAEPLVKEGFKVSVATLASVEQL
ncbi:MAG: ComF family protein [Bacteroidales bacterium]|nr:ComF family protein [Bacteroidales bacterium]